MRGLSLTQPWATLVAIGAKSIETRSWSTSYRGELVIHAASGFPRDCQALCWREPFQEVLIAAGYDRAEKLPRGVVLATAILDSVVPSEDMDRVWQRIGYEAALREQAFGDYGPRRFGWLLRDVRRLPAPLPQNGALGLWAVRQILCDAMAGQGVL